MFKKNSFIFISMLFLFKIAYALEPLIIFADGEYVMGAGETMEVSEEKAKEEYHYLCETFKDDKSCKNVTRLQ